MNRDTRWLSLMPGDHIQVQRDAGYSHHGIYVGGLEVVHFVEGALLKLGAKIARTSLRSFLSGGVLQWGDSKKKFSREKLVQRALRRLGDTGYHLLENNCETFAVWVRTGKGRSKQAERVIDFALRVKRKADVLYAKTKAAGRRAVRKAKLWTQAAWKRIKTWWG
jgi:hypothetical protein